MKASIKAISYYLPPKSLSNDELSSIFPEWSVEKIEQKTGIKNRHIAEPNICSSDLAVESGRKLFLEHNISQNDIDFLILCTQSPDYLLPTSACIIQNRLGLPTTAGALDINLGCSGFVYGLSLARSLIISGDAKNVLLITAETYSKYIHPEDKSVRTIFGDASAATLISESETSKIDHFVFGTDGSGANNLIVKHSGMRDREKNDSIIYDEYGNKRDDNSLYMNGAEIFNFTIKSVPKMINDIYQKSNLSEQDLKLYILHQANKYMLETIKKKIKVPDEKFYYYLKDCGNTVSSTIPIALYNAIEEGRIKKNDKILIAGFGVGYSWAGCIIEY